MVRQAQHRGTQKFKLSPEPSVIAQLCFFEHLEMVFEHFLFRKGNAIDTLEHFILTVAAPVCSACAEELEIFQFFPRTERADHGRGR